MAAAVAAAAVGIRSRRAVGASSRRAVAGARSRQPKRAGCALTQAASSDASPASWERDQGEPCLKDDELIAEADEESEIDWRPEVWKKVVLPESALAPQRESTARRVFVAVDDTSPSAHALRWCNEEFLREGDTVIICHVVPFADVSAAEVVGGVSGAYYVAMTDRERHDHMLCAAERLLETMSREFTANQVELVAVIERTREGVAQVLLEKAMEEGASAIIVGCRGQRWWQDAMMGSVASYLLHHVRDFSLPLVIVN